MGFVKFLCFAKVSEDKLIYFLCTDISRYQDYNIEAVRILQQARYIKLEQNEHQKMTTLSGSWYCKIGKGNILYFTLCTKEYPEDYAYNMLDQLRNHLELLENYATKDEQSLVFHAKPAINQLISNFDELKKGDPIKKLVNNSQDIQQTKQVYINNVIKNMEQQYNQKLNELKNNHMLQNQQNLAKQDEQQQLGHTNNQKIMNQKPKEISKEDIKKFLSLKKSSMTSVQVLSGINFLKEYGYFVIDLIDTGAFGVVILAIDANNNREVAIKMLTLSSAEDLKGSVLEFQKVNSLNHPNIIKFYQQLYDDDNELFFIISEFCKNGNLHNYSKKNKLNMKQITKISMEIIEGVMQIHSKKIIHSDLKPQNILLSDNNSIKICDLGLSKIIKGNQSNTSVMGGTLAYMPQEQLNGQLRQESDIFALGTIICFLCGIGVEDNHMVMYNLKNGQFPSIENNQFQDILKIAFKMMAFEPKERLPLQDSLKEFQKL